MPNFLLWNWKTFLFFLFYIFSSWHLYYYDYFPWFLPTKQHCSSPNFYISFCSLYFYSGKTVVVFLFLLDCEITANGLKNNNKTSPIIYYNSLNDKLGWVGKWCFFVWIKFKSNSNRDLLSTLSKQLEKCKMIEILVKKKRKNMLNFQWKILSLTLTMAL